MSSRLRLNFPCVLSGDPFQLKDSVTEVILGLLRLLRIDLGQHVCQRVHVQCHNGCEVCGPSHDIREGVRGVGEDLARNVAEKVMGIRGKLEDLDGVEETFCD